MGSAWLWAVVLAAAPTEGSPAGRTPVDAWAEQVCPHRPPRDDSNLAAKEEEARLEECLRRAMNRALDAILLPLKQQKAPSFNPWMAVQADYNAWMGVTCQLTEALVWVDLASGTIDDGSARGFAFLACMQRLAADRGWFAAQLRAGDGAAVAAHQQARGAAGRAQEAALTRLDARLQALGRRPPPPREEVGPQPLDVAGLREQVARVREGAARIATAQCALVAPADAACAERVRTALLSLASAETQDDVANREEE